MLYIYRHQLCVHVSAFLFISVRLVKRCLRRAMMTTAETPRWALYLSLCLCVSRFIGACVAFDKMPKPAILLDKAWNTNRYTIPEQFILEYNSSHIGMPKPAILLDMWCLIKCQYLRSQQFILEHKSVH